jgi:hypothetical protein
MLYDLDAVADVIAQLLRFDRVFGEQHLVSQSLSGPPATPGCCGFDTSSLCLEKLYTVEVLHLAYCDRYRYAGGYVVMPSVNHGYLSTPSRTFQGIFFFSMSRASISHSHSLTQSKLLLGIVSNRLLSQRG